jgi:hypothetical protein
VLFSDRRRTKDLVPGLGQRLHVVRCWYETAVTHDNVHTVLADGVVLAEVIFPNQYVWARYQLPEWRWRDADDPLGKGVSLDFSNSEAAEVDIGDGVSLTVKPTWWSEREIEQLRVGSGLSLALSADQPIPTARAVLLLEWMQDLIGLCWGGRVIPLPGAGRLNHTAGEPGKFWAQRLFDPHQGQLADLSHPFPAVYLPDLGGNAAFARWLTLCRDHSRATRGVSEGLYVGASVETRLLNTVTAIAYWVGRHRRTHEWASIGQSNNDNQLRRLVMHLLPRFKDWFGDGELFSERLWWDYNQIKHDPSHSIDYTLVSRFTLAARTLLIASLLDKVAGTTLPSERIAAYYWQLRDLVKELLDDKNRCMVNARRYTRHKGWKT